MYTVQYLTTNWLGREVWRTRTITNILHDALSIACRLTVPSVPYRIVEDPGGVVETFNTVPVPGPISVLTYDGRVVEWDPTRKE